jgi:hypothetical protein
MRIGASVCQLSAVRFVPCAARMILAFMGLFRVEKESASFLKKRSKKLLHDSASVFPDGGPRLF